MKLANYKPTALRLSAALLLATTANCSLGPTELVLILAIVVVLFGASRLPQLGKALGETVKGFRDATGGGDKHDAKSDKKEDAEKAQLQAREITTIHDAKIESAESTKTTKS